MPGETQQVGLTQVAVEGAIERLPRPIRTGTPYHELLSPFARLVGEAHRSRPAARADRRIRVAREVSCCIVCVGVIALTRTQGPMNGHQKET